ncbi:MAG: FAD-dependent oxidoreductase [Caulobacteraceae bacterium]
MRTCDVAVIGLGLMGSAALYALAQQGADALGFDPRPVGSDRGSSHGSCRVFRRFNAENPAYHGAEATRRSPAGGRWRPPAARRC